MTTLTVIGLNSKARTELWDSHRLHAMIALATDSQPGRSLWAYLSGERTLVIQSATQPNLAPFDGLIRDVHHGEARTFWPQGERIRATLVANPTKSKITWDLENGPRGLRGQRISLPPEEHEAWFRRKLGEAINIDTITCEPIGTRGGNRNGQRVTHRLAACHLTGTVQKPDALASLILNGVGPAKAYGAGLLLVQVDKGSSREYSQELAADTPAQNSRERIQKVSPGIAAHSSREYSQELAADTPAQNSRERIQK